MADSQQTTSNATNTEKRCRIDKCKRPYQAKGLCNVHYREWRQGKHPKARYKICHHEACRKPTVRHGLCEAHGKAAKGETAT